MSEGKKNIIGMLLEEYDIKSAKDIEDALKDLLGGTIQEMLESEMDEHLGYQEYERSSNPDYRNGRKTKKIRGNIGETEIEVPQERDGRFEPKVVKKRQKDISGIEQKIISLYAKGMTTRQISETIEDIYGFEVSDGMVSDITDRLLPQIEDWQKRPLDEVYPIVFLDAVHFSVRDNGQIRKLAAYVILAVSMTGHKEVLSIHIGENESAKYWLGVGAQPTEQVLNLLKITGDWQKFKGLDGAEGTLKTVEAGPDAAARVEAVEAQAQKLKAAKSEADAKAKAEAEAAATEEAPAEEPAAEAE